MAPRESPSPSAWAGDNLFHVEDFVVCEMSPDLGTDPTAPPAAGGNAVLG